MGRAGILCLTVCLALLFGCTRAELDPKTQARVMYLESVAEQKRQEAEKLYKSAEQMRAAAKKKEQEAKEYRRKAKRAARGQEIDGLPEM